MDDLCATKSEGVGLIGNAISFQEFQPMSSRYLIVTDRRTDGQTDESNLNAALCTSASLGKNAAKDNIYDAVNSWRLQVAASQKT